MARRPAGAGARRIAALRTALTGWLGRPLADFHLLLAVFGLLTALGLVMVLSASSPTSVSSTGSAYSVFAKQAVFACVGLVAFYVGLRVPLRRIRALSAPALLVCLVLLVLVLTPLGTEAGGARSWFTVLPGVSFQPIEVAKVALALWGAHVLVTKRAMLHQYRHLLVPLVPVALIMFALLMLQPDLGGTITLVVVLISLLWFVGAPMRLFAALAAGLVVGVVTLALVADYREARVLAFLNPEADPDASFQSVQAIYALASGGLFGKGLSQGTAKWQYLPRPTDDFIFAVIGEELGLLGCAVVLGLFALLAVTGLRIASRNTDPWIRLVSGTLTVWLVAQAAINIGYVVRLLPVTGITLPLISAGGTSMVTTMLVFGILANCARHEPEAVAALRTFGPGRVGGLLRLPATEPYRPPARRRPARPSTPPKRPGRPAGVSGRSAAQLMEERWRAGRSAPPSDYRRRGARRTGQQRSARGRGSAGYTSRDRDSGRGSGSGDSGRYGYGRTAEGGNR
ncbi:putative lipid II flippase FtsW [Goodfellowiella coeruleoviolacea]|uniref:Probable peptidoglycan glycosyltransferase FtsW n=1 Tax=Goodfellowiella coeruleoviolacea TaxID=334858 RepID=A0AAE3GJV0_9PSEU|nr:putative lipid II flippase FtsW [Goodfellowiella coeruleoviolacea]MCP2169540.1 cell division-specific peptidoglycan biosynthesis regulator FtsW [Goodfellowiella coeruleoviolacea]